ncbi:MAG: SAM-dependent chlorinase/fluorinase [Gammaproteobacteria bacterium]|nr:SAM-dependent chlorinase/fluorinase [Gammaproteobacteria bacterium]
MLVPRQVVYFFSDFGLHGPYAGQVEAVIAHRSQAHFINLLSNAPSADPFRSSYLLAALYQELPVKRGYFLAVVDPGVGSARQVITFQIGKMTFLGPDNGLFSRLIARHDVKKVALLNYPTKRISNSFHARDWFAPELTKLINGEAMDFQFVATTKLIGSDWAETLNEIIYVDHYGNLISGVPAKGIPNNMTIMLGTQAVFYAGTFSKVPSGALFWYENSMGLLEIAANSASASELTSSGIGSEIYFSDNVKNKTNQ